MRTESAISHVDNSLSLTAFTVFVALVLNHRMSKFGFSLEEELFQVRLLNFFRLVEKIRNFLQHEYTQTKLITPSSESEAASRNLEGAANEDSSSATSDDSFERIDSADLADYDHAKTEVDNDIPSESILSLSPSTEELKDLPLESSEEQLPPASESTPPSSRVDQQTSESVDGPAAPSDVGLNPWGRSGLLCHRTRLTINVIGVGVVNFM